MKRPPITLEPYGVSGSHLMTLFVRVEGRESVRTVSRTFCQLDFHEHPERMPEFFRRLADDIDQIVL